MKPIRAHRPPLAAPRRGATLTEVLMSLMIMGLGITSVFTLFPMTVVRSVKATNLTHATLLAESVREGYRALKFVLALPPARTPANRPPNSTYTHPKDPLLSDVTDNLIPDPFIGTFVVDPYGGASSPTYGGSSGRFGEVNPGTTTGHAWGVLRVANGYGIANVTSPDSWITAYEEIPASTANVGGVSEFTFPGTPDFASTVSPSNSRVLVMSADNRQSFVAPLHATNPVPAPNKLRLSVPLPASLFNPSGSPPVDNVGLVRVQNFERRYTYLLTLHRDPRGNTTSQIVVYFRRSFDEAELLYDVVPNSIVKQTHQLTVTVPTRRPNPGEFAFGTWITTNPRTNQVYHHGRWHRLVAVEETGNPNEYRLTLDRPWQAPDQGAFANRLMFPRGVISVFDL
jgi:type II secretory pathway pseudopilin PulG